MINATKWDKKKNGNEWTDKQLKKLKQYSDNGLFLEEIIYLLDMKESRVIKRMGKHGFPIKRYATLNKLSLEKQARN